MNSVLGSYCLASGRCENVSGSDFATWDRRASTHQSKVMLNARIPSLITIIFYTDTKLYQFLLLIRNRMV